MSPVRLQRLSGDIALTYCVVKPRLFRPERMSILHREEEAGSHVEIVFTLILRVGLLHRGDELVLRLSVCRSVLQHLEVGDLFVHGLHALGLPVAREKKRDAFLLTN